MKHSPHFLAVFRDFRHIQNAALVRRLRERKKKSIRRRRGEAQQSGSWVTATGEPPPPAPPAQSLQHNQCSRATKTSGCTHKGATRARGGKKNDADKKPVDSLQNKVCKVEPGFRLFLICLEVRLPVRFHFKCFLAKINKQMIQRMSETSKKKKKMQRKKKSSRPNFSKRLLTGVLHRLPEIKMEGNTTRSRLLGFDQTS